MKWDVVKLGDYCTITSSKRCYFSQRVDQGIPFYRSKEIIQIYNGQEVTECDYISLDQYSQIKEKFGVPQAGDLLLTTRGTIGIPYIYKGNDRFYFADGNLTWMKDFSEQLFQQFLYYWFISYEGASKIDSIAVGAAQKAVPISGLKNMQIPLPPLSVQRRIADILSAYDDLIENNQKQIKLLEEAAMRLYKEWFVYLRFPGYENTPIVNGVPEGWREISIGKLLLYEIGGGWGQEIPTGNESIPAYVIRGTDIDPFLYGNIRSVPYRYHSDSNLSSRQLQDGDIIFEVSGGSKKIGVAKTLLIRQSVLDAMHAPVMCASFCKVMRTIKKEHSQFLYTFLQYIRTTKETEKFEKRSASSIVNYRWKDFLAQQNILIPNDNILRGFNNNAENIYQKQIILSIQIEKIQEARDKLLPKLMSGEIEV